MTESDGTVLVTGGTGFLGGWCVATCSSGETTSARRFGTSRVKPAVRAAITKAGIDDPGARLSVTSSGPHRPMTDGRKRSTAAVRAPRGVAVPAGQPKDPDDSSSRRVTERCGSSKPRLAPASTRGDDLVGRRLRGAGEYREQALHRGGLDRRRRHRRTPYVRSKTLAEHAAWDHARGGAAEAASRRSARRDHRPGPQRRPLLSLQAVQRLLDGMPAIPRLGFTFVDVATSPTCTSAR